VKPSSGWNEWNVCSWWRSTVVTTLVYDQQTFPGLRHDVQLTGDLFRVNRPQYISQNCQLSHSSSWSRQMSSKLNSGICYAYMRGGAAWEMLASKADMVLFTSNTVWSISERVTRSSRRRAIQIDVSFTFVGSLSSHKVQQQQRPNNKKQVQRAASEAVDLRLALLLKRLISQFYCTIYTQNFLWSFLWTESCKWVQYSQSKKQIWSLLQLSETRVSTNPA